MEYAGGDYAAQALIETKAYSERMKFLKQPLPGWLTLDTGNLAALVNGTDPTPRDSYLELVTKSLNNYYPPGTALACRARRTTSAPGSD